LVIDADAPLACPVTLERLKRSPGGERLKSSAIAATSSASLRIATVSMARNPIASDVDLRTTLHQELGLTQTRYYDARNTASGTAFLMRHDDRRLAAS